jgi:hypothetical protein
VFRFEVSHLLTSSQKAARLEVVKVMAQQLATHANAGFHHPLASDESWMASDYTASRIWMMALNGSS